MKLIDIRGKMNAVNMMHRVVDQWGGEITSRTKRRRHDPKQRPFSARSVRAAPAPSNTKRQRWAKTASTCIFLLIRVTQPARGSGTAPGRQPAGAGRPVLPC